MKIENENLRASKKMYEHPLKLTKIYANLRKSMKIYEKLRKSMKIHGNVKIFYENLFKSIENLSKIINFVKIDADDTIRHRMT